MDLTRTRRAVFLLLACGAALMASSSPTSAAQPATPAPDGGGNDMVEPRQDTRVLLPRLFHHVVQLPSDSLQQLTSSAKVVRRPEGVVQVDGNIPRHASLSVRVSQPVEQEDQRTPSTYPSSMVRSTITPSPLGPVVQSGGGDQSRDRITDLDIQ